MTQVGIAELKARLSKYLRQAKEGDTVEVLDRGVPVARIGPPDWAVPAMPSRPATKKLTDLKPPPPIDVPFDVVEELLKTRRNER